MMDQPLALKLAWDGANGGERKEITFNVKSLTYEERARLTTKNPVACARYSKFKFARAAK